jgi:hypothetical protein
MKKLVDNEEHTLVACPTQWEADIHPPPESCGCHHVNESNKICHNKVQAV